MLRIQEYVCPTCKSTKTLQTQYDHYQFPNKILCGYRFCTDYLLRIVFIGDTEKEK